MKYLAQIGTLMILMSAGVLNAAKLPVQAGSTQNQQQTPDAQSSPPASDTHDSNQGQSPGPISQPEESTTPPVTQANPNNSGPKPPNKSGHPRAASEKRKKSAKASSGSEQKVVVHNGGARDSSPELSPAMTKEQALHSRESTSQLLSTTEANVKKVAGRQLSPAQASMLDQIHAYVRESKAASTSGDLARAHTFAYKAHLLSDDLASK